MSSHEIERPIPVGKIVSPEQIAHDPSMLLGDSAHGAKILIDDNEDWWVVKSDGYTKDKARNEVAMINQFQREGLSTLCFPPGRYACVATMKDSEQTVLMLPYMESLRPLTTLGWDCHVGTADYEMRKDDLRDAISLAAKIHKRGFVHGDYQLKNLGRTLRNKLIVYDLERAKFTGDMSSAKEERSQSLDLISLFKSARLNGLFNDTQADVRNAEIADILFWYYEKLKTDASSGVAEISETEIIKWFDAPENIQRSLGRYSVQNS